MASVQGGEKQLFEKFWQGTFKAVATPRPGSVIVASITARKPLASVETPSCLLLSTGEKSSREPHPVQKTLSTNGCVRHRSRSPSCNKEFSPPPPPKGKKKKKKSTRKKRRRSPSCSLSPVKKKKKKKNSKKRKRSRLSSKKRRHSSSSPKSKRKEEKKHKKHSHSHSQKSHRPHHRRCSSGSESTNSLSESCESRPRTRPHEEGHKARWKHTRRSSKSARKSSGTAEVTVATPSLGSPLLNNHPLPAAKVISKAGDSIDLSQKAEGQLGQLVKGNREPREYDSGNDTASPPSARTSTSRSKASEEANCSVPDGFDRTFSPGKANGGSSSDSGNSFTSCLSRTKGAALGDPAPSPRIQEKTQRETPLQSLSHSEKNTASLVSAPFNRSLLSPCVRNTSSSSRSSPESSRYHSPYHKASPRSSHSRSCSSDTRSYSRSPSYSPKSYKRGPESRGSRQRRSSSYSRYSRDREPDHKYSSTGKDSHRHRGHRHRKPSYSPLRKRRRDSPSHLEARRITSARKRPIPYYRPSPSSSSSPSSISSYSSWYSDLSPSPSRSSRSYSKSRTSRSRSWSSDSSSETRHSRRSCSRSSGSTGSYASMRH